MSRSLCLLNERCFPDILLADALDLRDSNESIDCSDLGRGELWLPAAGPRLPSNCAWHGDSVWFVLCREGSGVRITTAGKEEIAEYVDFSSEEQEHYKVGRNPVAV